MTVFATHPIVTSLSPEFILVLGGVLVLLLGLARRQWLSLVTFAVFALALITACRLRQYGAEPVQQLTNDSLLWYARLVGLSVGLLIVLVNRHVPAEGELKLHSSLLPHRYGRQS